MYKILSIKVDVDSLGKEIGEPDGSGGGEVVIQIEGKEYTLPVYIWHKYSLTGETKTEPTFVVWVRTGEGNDDTAVSAVEEAHDDFIAEELEEELEERPEIQIVLKKLVADFNPKRKS